MENSSLDIDMSQLVINEKKRNVTGVLKHKANEEDVENSTSKSEEDPQQLRRSNRKKVRPQESEKRRVLTKPKKLLDGNNTINEINNYYLDKTVKRLAPSLETIFEEPKGNVFMSSRRFKRFIQFSSETAPSSNKLKLKKRSMKAKKVSVIKRLKKSVALALVKEKLSVLEGEEE